MLRLVIINTLLLSLSFSQNEEIKIAKVEVEGNEVTSKKTIIFTAGLRAVSYTHLTLPTNGCV